MSTSEEDKSRRISEDLNAYTLNTFLYTRGDTITLMSREEIGAGPDERYELEWLSNEWVVNDFRDMYGLNDTSDTATPTRVLGEWLLESADVPDPVHTPPEQLKAALIDLARREPALVRERLRIKQGLSPEQIAPYPHFGILNP